MPSIPKHFFKTVASSATPEVLGVSTVEMQSLQFRGEKSFGVNNTGNVTVQVKDLAGNFVDALLILPGDIVNYPAPPGGYYTAADFFIKVATNADGVHVFCSAFTA